MEHLDGSSTKNNFPSFPAPFQGLSIMSKYPFSYGSLKQRDTLHPDLQKVVDEAAQTCNFSIICGHRNQEDQNRAFQEGKSKQQWPNSRHNSSPSEAVDCAPYPLDWNNAQEFAVMAGHILAAAERVGVKIEWGGRWKSIVDLPHFQLAKP